MKTALRYALRALPLASLFATVSTAFAANINGSITITFGNGATLGGVFNTILLILNGYIVPLIFAIAFIVFLWGVYQYFIAGGADEEKRKQGRQFIIYGLLGFVLMFAVWGIVNIILNTFGFNGAQRPCLPTFGFGCV